MFLYSKKVAAIVAVSEMSRVCQLICWHHKNYKIKKYKIPVIWAETLGEQAD